MSVPPYALCGARQLAALRECQRVRFKAHSRLGTSRAGVARTRRRKPGLPGSRYHEPSKVNPQVNVARARPRPTASWGLEDVAPRWTCRYGDHLFGDEPPGLSAEEERDARGSKTNVARQPLRPWASAGGLGSRLPSIEWVPVVGRPVARGTPIAVGRC